MAPNPGPADPGAAAAVPDDALRRAAQAMRRRIVEQSLASNVGHIGSALSIAEIVVVLFDAVLRGAGTRDPDRDRFILGKGHASLALYCALRARGLLDDAALATYAGDASLLGVHPEVFLPGVDVSTGSLGQGLSVGCGLALGLRERRSPARVAVLVSDAECNEGQVWEAVMFAAHHRLSNLTVVVDLNGLQAMGRTEEVLRLDRMAERWSAFGWDAADADGHDVAALRAALAAPVSARPRVVVARTVLGKGVSFMEDRLEWHYRNLTPELAAQALREIGEPR
jgi:transketolase